ncbi:MAG: hypothetical protein PWP37_259 [Thermotogota bacterium]|nr:hypothetical protein [Thermotogota bacterium]MDK2864067.1 hypothetical protein [Thermotogota bacterium]
MITSIFLPLAAGFVVGMIVKRKPKSIFFWISLLVLLFFVGYQTGSAVSDFGALYSVLKDAVVVALFAIAGSVAFAVLIWRKTTE